MASVGGSGLGGTSCLDGGNILGDIGGVIGNLFGLGDTGSSDNVMGGNILGSIGSVIGNLFGLGANHPEYKRKHLKKWKRHMRTHGVPHAGIAPLHKVHMRKLAAIMGHQKRNKLSGIDGGDIGDILGTVAKVAGHVLPFIFGLGAADLKKHKKNPRHHLKKWKKSMRASGADKKLMRRIASLQGWEKKHKQAIKAAEKKIKKAEKAVKKEKKAVKKLRV
jgi:septin family protein